MQRQNNNVTRSTRHCKRWNDSEDQLLIRTCRSFPQNLHKCFTLVAEQIERTPSAVAGHWYTSLSKKPEALCFFTASPKHVSRNRKNGMGVESNSSIWRRLMSVIRNLI